MAYRWSWTCPDCGETYTFNKRVTLGKRTCSYCGKEITTDEIDRQQREKEAAEALIRRNRSIGEVVKLSILTIACGAALALFSSRSGFISVEEDTDIRILQNPKVNTSTITAVRTQSTSITATKANNRVRTTRSPSLKPQPTQTTISQISVTEKSETSTQLETVPSTSSSGNSRRVKHGGVTLEVLSIRIEEANTRDLSFFAKCNTDCIAVVFNVTIENTSGRDGISGSELLFRLTGIDGVVYEGMPFIVDAGHRLASSFLEKGEKTTGAFSFGIPRSIKKVILTYRPTLLDPPVKLEFELP